MALENDYQKISEVYIGSLAGSDRLYLRLYAKLDSQSISNNTSTYTLQSRIYNSTNYYSYSGNCYASIDGTQIQNNTNLTFNQGELILGNKTITVAHSSDGKCSQYKEAKFRCYGISEQTAGGYFDLPTIPRQATITSAPDFNDEQNPTIKYSNPAGNSVSSLQACISFTGATADIKYRDISKTGSSYTFNLTESERELLRTQSKNSKSITVKFYVRTKIGDNTYHSKIDKTLTIVNANPTIQSVSYEDTDSRVINITKNKNVIVKDKSTIAFYGTNMVAYKAATLKSISITLNNVTKTFALSGTSIANQGYEYGTTSLSQNGNATITITDSRGYTVSKTISITINDYSVVLMPKVELKRLSQTSSTVKLNIEGTWFNNKIGETQNVLTLQYGYKESDSSSGFTYVSITPTKTGDKFTYSNNALRNDLDHNKAYDFVIIVDDKLSNYTYKDNITKGIPTLELGENDARTNGIFIADNKYEYIGYCKVTSTKTIAKSGQRTITFDTSKTYNSEYTSEYATISNNGFTINKSGVYRITHTVRLKDNTTGTSTSQGVGAAINGAKTDETYTWATNSSRLTISASYIVELSENDEIKLIIYSDIDTSISSGIFHLEKILV